MTNEEQTRAIQNLTDRMNRIEATVAHNKPVVIGVDPAVSAIDTALVLLERVQEMNEKQNKDMARIAQELRNGR